MINQERFIELFKEELIKSIKEETEKEIKNKVKEFEEHLREMAMTKITNYVDGLKIYLEENYHFKDPQISIHIKL